MSRSPCRLNAVHAVGWVVVLLSRPAGFCFTGIRSRMPYGTENQADMYYASQTDRQHALRKLAHHRIVARCLRGDRGDLLLERAQEALDELEDGYGRTPFVLSWREMLSRDRLEIADEIVRRGDEIETMRESSPFMRVFHFDLGQKMRIDFQSPEIRTRMWNLAKRLAMIEPKEAVAVPVRGPTPF